MELHLASQVHATLVGGELVFLDLAADRYLCVPDAARLVRLSGDRARLDVSEPELAAQLAAAGLVGGQPAPDRLPPRECPRPARDLPPAARGRLRVGDLLGLVAATTDAGQGYAGRGLAALVEAARREERPSGVAAPGDGVARAQAFQRFAPFTPLPSKCLLRAFLLRRRLRRGGHDPAWVFGVRTWPFEAHCWIQLGDMVLDDSWERLARFDPILVI